MGKHRFDWRPCGSQPSIELETEQDVGELRLLIEGLRRVRPLTIQVVEMDRPAFVQVRSHGDHASSSAPAEGLIEEPAQRKVTEVVGGELRLETLWAEPSGREHDAGVVDQHVYRDPATHDRSRESPHRFDVGQVEEAIFDRGARLLGFDPGDGVQTLRLVAGRDDHRASVASELTGSLESEPAVGSRDDEGATGLVVDLVGGPLSHGPLGYVDR